MKRREHQHRKIEAKENFRVSFPPTFFLLFLLLLTSLFEGPHGCVERLERKRSGEGGEDERLAGYVYALVLRLVFSEVSNQMRRKARLRGRPWEGDGRSEGRARAEEGEGAWRKTVEKESVRASERASEKRGARGRGGREGLLEVAEDG